MRRARLTLCSSALLCLLLAGCSGKGLSTAEGPVATVGPTLAALATRRAERATAVPVTVEAGERVPSYEAAEVIRRYAERVLGIEVVVRQAGGVTGTLGLPAPAQASVDAAVSLAGATYMATLEGGLASVSLGDGQVSGDLQADIDGASLGVFVMVHDGGLPDSGGGALNLIRQTFPGLAEVALEPVALEAKGYAFAAQDSHQSLSGDGYHLVARRVYAAVTPALQEGRVWVWAVVAHGSLTKAWQLD